MFEAADADARFMYAKMQMDLQKKWKAKVKVSNLDTARMTLCPYLKLTAAFSRSTAGGTVPADESDFHEEQKAIEILARAVLPPDDDTIDPAHPLRNSLVQSPTGRSLTENTESSRGTAFDQRPPGDTKDSKRRSLSPSPSLKLSVNKAKAAGCLWVTISGHFRSFLFNVWNLKSFFELANTNLHCVYFVVVVRAEAEAPGGEWWGNRGADNSQAYCKGHSGRFS
eukprot:g12102.t1